MKYCKVVSAAATVGIKFTPPSLQKVFSFKLLAIGIAHLLTTSLVWAGKATVPAAPSNLAAAGLSSNQIKLTWQDNASNETGFKIERAPTSTGAWLQIATVSKGVTVYTNSGLTASTTYYFRVRSYNSRGSSSYSAVANATTLAAGAPCMATISLSSSPTGGGSASGGGTVTCGTSVTVSATASSGYNFVNWTENGTAVSTSSSYTLAANASHSLVANFAAVPCNVTISLSSSPTGGGTTSGGGTVSCGTSVTVSAAPSSGYSFVNWTENGTAVSTSVSYSFTANASHTLVANFAAVSCSATITTSSSPTGGGTTSGGGTVNCGTSVTVSAAAGSCYNFVNWTENGSVVSTSSAYTFTANASHNLVANFAQKTYVIVTSSSPAGAGTATGGGTVNCGSSVTVVASANAGFGFVNWTENGTAVSASASYTFSANANRFLAANFTGTLDAYWTFDTNTVSGTTVLDSSGNGNNATLMGTVLPTIVAGRTNQAISLDGISGLVSVPDSANLNIKGPFTVSAWVNFKSLPSGSQYPNIVAKLNSSSSCYGYGLYWSGSGVSGIIGSGSPSWTSVGSGYTPAVGAWNHYVVVFDGANMLLYVNGTNFSQTAASTPGDTTSIPLKMGAHYSDPLTYGYLNAKLDDARVYTRALSAADVALLYAAAGSTCTATITPGSASYTASGGSGSVSVSAASGCTWGVSSSVAWVTVTSGSSGSANGTVNYTVAANTSASSRTGTIAIDSKTFTVTQTGVPCTATITPGSASYTASGGSGSVSVSAPSGCTWGVSSSVAWVTVTSGSSGSANGTVNYTVAANTSASSRSGTIAIDSQTFTVTQAGVPCTATITPGSASYTASGGSGSVSVSAPSGCTWGVSSSVAWVTVTSGSSGSANGTVNYTVAANTSASSRSGTIAIDSQTFTVTQAGVPCTATITPGNASYTASGGSGSVSVSAPSGCSWGVSSSVAWVTVTSGSSGSANGTVNYTVAANTSASSRSGTITIGSQTFTVNQAGHLAPIANAGANQSTSVGTALNFNGSGSMPRDGATLTSYNWAFGDLATASGAVVSHAYSAAGTFVVTLTVTDSFGATGSGTATITVTNVTVPLTVTLTSPTSGATVSSTITLAATASANATRVEFYCDNQTTPLGTATSSPFTASCNTTVMANGSHSFYAKTYDAAGNWANSASVTATVNNSVVPGGQLTWLKTVQNALTSSSAMSYGFVADRAGNVYSVGAFSGTIDFGQGSVTSVGGGYDCFIVKYNTSGGVVWVKTMGGSGTDSISSIAIDSQDNIIVTGGFHNVVDFGGVTLTSQGGNDMFVAKYSSAGVLSWAKRFGGTWEDFGSAVAVDGSDNIFLAARFQSQPADFGGLSLSALGWYDIALVKLTSAGSTSWAKRWGGTDQDLPTSIAIDRYGDLLVCGQFWGTGDVGGGSKTSVGGSDMFVAKYSSADGTCKWSRVMGGVNDDNVNGITTDPNTGNVLVTGGYAGSIDFGSGTPVLSGSGGAAMTMFVAAYDNSGNFLWVKNWGGDITGISDTGMALKVDGTGNLALTGYYNSWMDFNRDGLEDAAGSGYFVAAFSISGNAQPVFRWASRSSTGTGIGNAVGFDGSGHLLTSGSWQAGTFKLGGISAITPGTGAFVTEYTK